MRSAERLLQVLKCFERERTALTVSEVAGLLELAPSTVRRLLQTLAAEGFLQQKPGSDRYRLHYEVIRLAAAALSGLSLVEVAAPTLDELRDRLGESVQLTVRDGAELLLVDRRASRHMMRAERAIGHRYEPYRGSAAGKVLLARLPDAELDRLLPPEGRWPPLTARGIADRAALAAALAQTRERGYALNEGETEPGVWAVAAPLCDQRGDPLAALSVPCPESRLTEDRRGLIVDTVVEAARRLSDAVPFAA